MSRPRLAGTAALLVGAAVTVASLATPASASTWPMLSVPSGPYAPPSAYQLAQLRGCESGGNYHIATGNGFYGAYQFDRGTWRGLGLPGTADQAPAAVQDRAATVLEVQRGWQPWPACSRRLGLRPVRASAQRASLTPHALVAALTDATVRVGQTTTLSGAVDSGGVPVVRQQSYDGVHWSTWGRVYSAADGRWHFDLRAGVPGTTLIRVYAPACHGRGAALTAPVRLRVSS